MLLNELFLSLTPDHILEAIEAAGQRTTGRMLQLNSLENRVYSAETEEDSGPYKNLVGKFYRPERWSFDAIREEHEFMAELQEQGIPVVAPLPLKEARRAHPECPTVGVLRQDQSVIYFAISPKVAGRPPEDLTADAFHQIGALIARLHNTGAAQKARYRQALDVKTMAEEPLAFLLKENWIPLELASNYESTVLEIIQRVDKPLRQTPFLRIHGDVHAGNLLTNTKNYFFLDFDDMKMGPAVQDLWLLPSGAEDRALREALLSGYESIRHLNRDEWPLTEGLRALRIINFSGWIAARWEDPSFKLAFPDFGSYRYWASELDNLRQRLRDIP